jgi:hypothetical protein
LKEHPETWLFGGPPTWLLAEMEAELQALIRTMRELTAVMDRAFAVLQPMFNIRVKTRLACCCGGNERGTTSVRPRYNNGGNPSRMNHELHTPKQFEALWYEAVGLSRRRKKR